MYSDSLPLSNRLVSLGSTDPRPLNPCVSPNVSTFAIPASDPSHVAYVGSLAAPVSGSSAAPPLPPVQRGFAPGSASAVSMALRGDVGRASSSFHQFRPTSPQPSVSHLSEVSEDPLLEDRSDVASQLSVVDHLPEAVQDSVSGSFRDSLLRLQQVCPDLAAPHQVQSEALSSFTESALGFVPVSQSKPLALQESAMVSAAVKDALATARHSPVVHDSGSLPGFPQALPVGKFLHPKAFGLSGNIGLGELVASSSVPDSTLSVSQEDLLLASSSAPRTISVPERAVIDNEEIARRSLVSCSLADSFLGGLVSSVGVPGSQPFELRQDINSRDVFDFALALSQVLRFTTFSIARIHLNQVLARRDALLASSPSVRDGRVRTSLRHVPLSTSSLFAGQVQPFVRRQAETSRDLASFVPAQSSSSQPLSGSRPGVSGPVSGQPAPSRPRARFPRAPSSRAPYSRRPAPFSQGPAKSSYRR